MDTEYYLPWFLTRIGIALAFLYAAFGSLYAPNDWIGFAPEMLRTHAFLWFFSAVEIALGLWLFSGRYTFWASLLAAFLLLGIIVFNLGALDIVFRDVPILFSALALASLSYKPQPKSAA